MNKNYAVIAGAMLLAAGSSLTLANPSMADSSGSSPSILGSLTDEVLQKAVDAVSAAESSAGITVPIAFFANLGRDYERLQLHDVVCLRPITEGWRSAVDGHQPNHAARAPAWRECPKS
jgi:hypothetical protein